MSTGYQINDHEGVYYLTFQIVDWIDVFTRQVYRDIVIESLRYSIENKNLCLLAFVIMSNHVHLIALSNDGKLSNTIRDIKKFTSNKILETIDYIPESRKEWMLNRFKFNASHTKHNKTCQLWTHENHAVYLYSPGFKKGVVKKTTPSGGKNYFQEYDNYHLEKEEENTEWTKYFSNLIRKTSIESNIAKQ